MCTYVTDLDDDNGEGAPFFFSYQRRYSVNLSTAGVNVYSRKWFNRFRAFRCGVLGMWLLSVTTSVRCLFSGTQSVSSSVNGRIMRV